MEIKKIISKSEAYFPQKQFMTITETASYTSFSINYLYQLVHQRAIPVYKPGRKLFFKISEIDSWISNSKQKSISEIQQEAVDGITSL
jgi:excisionase family DNA binding protein